MRVKIVQRLHCFRCKNENDASINAAYFYNDLSFYHISSFIINIDSSLKKNMNILF